ncbi:MAG: hypothetical protein IJB90_04760 [Clostridia bacterium]|nr:hypothetical protein [Clostridia bacterium]
MLFFHKPGIVNVKMIITEEKILSNIDKVQKMINPNNKKQIIQLEEDAYFKDLIDSIKTYLIEYPKKKNFPYSVYKAAYGLVEFATNQFEENTKQIETLIRQRENNISKAAELKEVFEAVQSKDKEWKNRVKQISTVISEDIVEALIIVGKCKTKKPANFDDAVKLIKARVSNLESNLHIEIDMERIEDRSKALSYIGIEVAEALKGIPTPVATEEKVKEEQTVKTSILESVEDTYYEETRFEVKPSLWQRIKNSKLVRTISYITKIRVRLDVPALPEGRGERN